MRVNIFRSETGGSFPQDYQGECYDFEPIPYAASMRDGLLMGSIYSSGDEPIAVVEAPEGSCVEESNGGDSALYLPGEHIGMSAADVLSFAKCGYMGLSIVR